MSSGLDPAKIRELSEVLEKAADYSVFHPDEAQRRAKSNFWSYFASSGTLPPERVELSTALRYGGNRAISQWWDLPGFQDWFANRDEFRQRVEFLADLALDQVYKLLHDQKANASAKVAAMKLIMEMGRKLSQKQIESTGSERIDSMSREELEKFIQDRLRYLPTKDIDNPE